MKKEVAQVNTCPGDCNQVEPQTGYLRPGLLHVGDKHHWLLGGYLEWIESLEKPWIHSWGVDLGASVTQGRAKSGLL